MSSTLRISRHRRGMALLVVMVIVMLVALAAYGFNQQMTDAYRASQLQIERAQARLTAVSAIEALRMTLEQPRGERLSWHRDQPDSFAAVPLDPDSGASEDDQNQWSFSVISPALDASPTEFQTDSDNPWRFGLTNESAKINLRVLDQWEQAQPGQAMAALMNLPSMDQPMAAALMRAYGNKGSEATTATSLSDRLGAFAGEGSDAIGADLSIGASGGDNDRAQQTRTWATFWCGGDWDHNYQLDSLELSLLGEQSSAADSGAIAPSTGELPLAWRDYLTFDSGQKNESLAGRPRVFINASNLQELHQDLLTIWPAEWANFVIAVRQHGIRKNRSSRRGVSLVSAAEWAPDFSIPASTMITSTLELVEATVEIRQKNEKPVSVVSPFSDSFHNRGNYIESLVDDVTVDPSPVIVGQVDVMEAPRRVLLGVPSMTAEIADQIVQKRASQFVSGSSASAGTSRDTIAWLYVENVVDLPTFIKLQPWIIVGGDCYHGQVVAFRDSLTPTFRCTVTLDGSVSHVAVRHFRSWNAWGKGFNIDVLRGEQSPNTKLDHVGSHLP